MLAAVGVVSFLVKLNDPRVILSIGLSVTGFAVMMALLNVIEKFDPLGRVIVFLLSFGMLIGGFVWLGVLALRADPKPPDPKADEHSMPPKKTSLTLRLADEPSEVSDAPGLLKGVVTPVEFTLADPLSGLAVVDGMALEVLDVIEDNTGSTQAILRSFKYPIDLTPEKRGRVPFGDKFKYAPGEVDRIILGVQADPFGHDYFVRVVVRWYDEVSAEKRELVSELLVLQFPAPFPFNTPGSERDRLSKLQQAKIDERLRQLRTQFAKP